MINFKRAQREGYDLNKLVVNLPPGPRTTLPLCAGAELHPSYSNNCDENRFYF